MVPVGQTDSYLEVATANPFDIDAEKVLAFATGREVRMLLASPARIRREARRALPRRGRASTGCSRASAAISRSRSSQDEDEDAAVSAEEASQRPIIRLVDMMLADGVTSRASDIHVEPIEGGVVVRYRIDGVLRQVMKIPRNAGLPLISRIKIMSGLDIADRLRPQDGRARVSVNGEPVDLRVSTLPASLGEKVVIRILSQRATVLTLEALGMHPDEQEAIKRLLRHKEGIVLVTGPTGSGKTTTLYSALRLIQSEGVNIVTVEDPVEYRLGENIVQVQVHEKAGLTFASALRSILRQDPDVVLIGEIRDQETAQIALQASLTGHLVLSTLHTNDAPNAVTRLVDMGMEAYKIASALRGVVAQRLMRRLCPACRDSRRRSRCPSASRASFRRAPRSSGGGLPRMRHDGLPRPVQHRRGADDERRARAADRPGRHRRPDRRGGAAPTACARSGRAGCGTCWRASRRIEELLRVTDVPPDGRAAAPRRARARAPAGRGARRRRATGRAARARRRPPRAGAVARFHDGHGPGGRARPATPTRPRRAAARAPACCWWTTRTSSGGS